MQPKPGSKRQVRIEMPNTSATYANGVIISTTPMSEIVFDFMQILPNDPRARVQHRILMTPAHAKLFLRALTQNLERYEAQHGEIQVPQRPGSLADQLFQGVIGGEQPDGGDEGEDESEDDDTDTSEDGDDDK